MMPLILILAACTPPPGTDTETADDGCNAARHEALIGQPRAQAERLALDQPVRFHHENVAVTLDYVSGLCNFVTDENGIILSISCG
jgi:hypothetical protein